MRSCTPVSGLTCWTPSLPLCFPPLMLSLDNCFTSETKWSQRSEAARWQHCKSSRAICDSGKSRRRLFKIMVTIADNTEISSVPQRFHTSGNASWAKEDHQSLTKITGNIHAAPALSVTRHIASPTSPLLPFTQEHFAKPALQRQFGGQTLTWNVALGWVLAPTETSCQSLEKSCPSTTTSVFWRVTSAWESKSHSCHFADGVLFVIPGNQLSGVRL